MKNILYLLLLSSISLQTGAAELLSHSGKIKELCNTEKQSPFECKRTTFKLGKNVELEFSIRYQEEWFDDGSVVIAGAPRGTNNSNEKVKGSYYIVLYNKKMELLGAQGEKFEFDPNEKKSLGQTPIFLPIEVIQKIENYDVKVYIYQ